MDSCGDWRRHWNRTHGYNGARVYISGRRKDVLEQTTRMCGASPSHPQGQIIPIVADITSKSDAFNLVHEVSVSKREKKLDLLVNNAGISGGTSSTEKGRESARALADELWKEDVMQWENVYRTNVIAPVSARTASVINISSILGVTRTSQYHMKYNVSKAASIRLNTLLAQELRQEGVKVRVNSIAPGIFPSEMTTDDSDDINKSNIPKGIPAGRPGCDEDVAQAILMLACNQYAYGQTIAIDGGYLREHP
ncbi:NAD(P)-binding protein [Schizopora paradoxa]|uniref:NAD(P)-binding protein n=1 Tax=Schizopora paradoxa TaxID=27342 RepID=A0A0H2RBH5_9AGAM|nr:NAD(P)-binding protein [Schizopora paradoxa]